MTAPRHGEASDDSDAPEDTDRIASALSQRCSSLARRILGGAGMATMVAHTMISAGESQRSGPAISKPTALRRRGVSSSPSAPIPPRPSAKSRPDCPLMSGWRSPKTPQNRPSASWQPPSMCSEQLHG
ncbi:hypothetical protein JCM18909_659 [Cutibacterium acnes JCM 18909]|nr:hypothetical protein JCM18909_659 [Cutibacterium acnes JCM 18909]